MSKKPEFPKSCSLSPPSKAEGVLYLTPEKRTTPKNLPPEPKPKRKPTAFVASFTGIQALQESMGALSIEK